MAMAPLEPLEREKILSTHVKWARATCELHKGRLIKLEGALLRDGVLLTQKLEQRRATSAAAAEQPRLSISRRDLERELVVIEKGATYRQNGVDSIASEIASAEEDLTINERRLRARRGALEMAQWAARARATSAAIHREPFRPPGWYAFGAILLEESDDRGLPATLLLVVEALQGDLLGLLALAAASRGLRRVVDTHVTAMLREARPDAALAGRCEWPWGTDEVNAPLHYAASVLSYAEPREAAFARIAAANPALRADDDGGGGLPAVRRDLERRARIRPALSQRALAAVHPHVARALPMRWSLRLLAALAKVLSGLGRVANQKDALDAVARELVGAEVPGLAAHVRCTYRPDTACACGQLARESFAAARDDEVCQVMVHRVARHLCRFDGGVREWRVRPECAWLAAPGERLGQALATFVAPRARSRTKRGRGENDDNEDVDPQAAAPEPPYKRYASCEHFLPAVATAMGVVNTDAERRKAPKAHGGRALPRAAAAQQRLASPKQRISTFFALQGVQREALGTTQSAAGPS